MSVVITTESTSDIPEREAEIYKIGVIPVHFQEAQDGGIATAAPNPAEYDRFFRSYTDRGINILHISMSGKLSSSYSNALSAAEKNPLVTVLDSGNISGGAGLICILTARKSHDSADIRLLKDYAEDIAAETESGYILSSTKMLMKSGRFRFTGVTGGGLMSIKPSVNIQGGLILPGKKYTGSLEKAVRSFINERLSREKINKELCVVMCSHENITEGNRLSEEIRKSYGFKTTITGFFSDEIRAYCGNECIGIAVKKFTS